MAGDASVSFADENDETATAASSAGAEPLISHGDLFAAVEECISDPRPLVDFFYHPTSNGNAEHDHLTVKERRDAICDVVRSSKFGRARARRLFAGLTPMLRKLAEEESYNNSQGENEDEKEEEEKEDSKVAEEEASRSILFLRCCAFLVKAYLEGVLAKQANSSRRSTQQKIDVIDEACEVAEILHDSLFPLQTCGTKEAQWTQSAIFSMCERWWHGNFEDREQVVTQLVPLLLIRSLDDSAQKNDVKRLFSIREAVDLLDFEDESILTLKMHLLRTVGNPRFLLCADGRKFVAHLFGVDPGLVVDLHRAVRAQIAGARKSILNAYADIYYNAWKASAEREEEEEGEENEERAAIQASIEENALQDLAFQVIHAAVPSTAKSVRTVLDKFYVHKKSPDVEGMLHRLYGPLLWRALSSANSTIRKQASVVLSDTFPLRDPEAGEERTEACVQMSVEALVSLMEDDVPSVRVAGSTAAARILREFWAAIPSQDIRTLLNHIVARHASDASSSAVRAAAIHAVTNLLEEERTHGVLRPLLPSLGNLIHDKTEKVRLAVVNLLLVVKRIRGMKYYHVVPADHLLARLAAEGRDGGDPRGPVAAGLSDLLGNSFFPAGKGRTMTDVVNRTLRLLGDNPGAAVTFYKNAAGMLSVDSVARLIAALVKCLCFFIVEEKKRNEEDVSNLSVVFAPEDASIEYRGGKGGRSNTALMATIAESVSILWESIEPQLKDAQNETAEELLTEVFSGNVLTEVYCHFEAKFEDDDALEGDDAKLLDCFRACVAILNCAGKLDESKIDGLRSRIVEELSKTSDMPEVRRTKANLSPNVALLCAWGMTDDVATCLASSITEYFSGDANELDDSRTRKSGASRKRKQRGSKGRLGADATGLPRLDIDVCLGILGHVLKGSYPASVLARESILKSETAFDAIASALLTAQRAAERMLKPRIADDVEKSNAMIKNIGISIECYGRLLVHKEAVKGEIPMKLSPEARSLMTWVTDTIVPPLKKLARSDDDNPLRDLDLSSILSAASPSLNRHSSSPSVGNLGDTSFLSARGSLDTFEDESRLASARAVAVAATSSVLCTFAEWLSVRHVGDAFVSEQISGWCVLLGISDDVARRALLQLMFHVAITSLQNEGDPTPLKEVLSAVKEADPGPTEAETISCAVSFVASFRDERLLKAAMSAIVDVARAIIVEAEEEEESHVDTSFLDKVGPCMGRVIESVLSEKRSSVVLARCLIGEPKASPVRGCLFEEIARRSPETDALNEVLREWEAERISADNEDKENRSINLTDSETVAA